MIKKVVVAMVYLMLGLTVTLAIAGYTQLSIDMQAKHFAELVKRGHTTAVAK